jgi:hypothetical protein
MGMAELKLSYNADETITVRVGKARESISLQDKSRGEIFDAVKWLAISKGARLSDVEVTEALQAVFREAK